MPPSNPYLAADVIVKFCGEVLDLDPRSRVTVTPKSDRTSTSVGGQGDVVQNRLHDRRATIEVETLETSKSAASLERASEDGRTGVLEILGLGGKRLASAEDAWLNEAAGGGGTTIRWRFDVAVLEFS